METSCHDKQGGLHHGMEGLSSEESVSAPSTAR